MPGKVDTQKMVARRCVGGSASAERPRSGAVVRACSSNNPSRAPRGRTASAEVALAGNSARGLSNRGKLRKMRAMPPRLGPYRERWLSDHTYTVAGGLSRVRLNQQRTIRRLGRPGSRVARNHTFGPAAAHSNSWQPEIDSARMYIRGPSRCAQPRRFWKRKHDRGPVCLIPPPLPVSVL